MKPPVEETLKKPHYGRCRICGRSGRFTKEHVPPKSSGNRGVIIVSSPDSDTHPGRVSMRPQHETNDGIFLYSLCDRCNNKTGHRYGADYSKFIDLIRVHAVPENVNKDVVIDASEFHPLRVIKQATSMMLSTSNPTSFNNHEFVASPGKSKKDLEGITIQYPDKRLQQEVYDQLRLFVQRRDSNDFPEDVHIYIFASVGKRVGFRTGIFTRVNLSTRSSVIAVATGLYPVHWVFTLGGYLDEGILDVTEWTNFGYKQPFTDRVNIPMRWLEGHYALDFRSPQTLYTSNFIHSMEMEGFVSSAKHDVDRLLEEALFFARTLGRRTTKGYLISTFSTGTFYEFGKVNGWLPEANVNTALAVLENRLKKAP